jgi:hypothetical protein
MKTSQLTERVQLWRRAFSETTEGDLAERWTHSTTVWADVRLKGAEKESLILDVRLRPTAHRFHRIYWKGLWADCPKTPFRNRDGLRFFAKTRPDLSE